MKKIISLPIILMMLFIASCDSDKPDNLPDSVSGTAKKSFVIISAAGTSPSQEIVFSLEDFSAISNYVKYVKQADVNASSFIEVTGITDAQDVNLTNVTLSLKSNSRTQLKLPEIDSNIKILADTSDKLTFLQNVMDEILRRGSSTVVLRYHSGTHMTNEDVLISMQFNSRFSF